MRWLYGALLDFAVFGYCSGVPFSAIDLVVVLTPTHSL
jgi:hypothetical protein